MVTPSHSIVADAAAVRTVTDANGRVLSIRNPTTLDRLRLFKAVGTNLASNERYLGVAMLAFVVDAIDGVPLPQPVNEYQIEAAVERLGDAAIAAIAAALNPADMEGLAPAKPGN